MKDKVFSQLKPAVLGLIIVAVLLLSISVYIVTISSEHVSQFMITHVFQKQYSTTTVEQTPSSISPENVAHEIISEPIFNPAMATWEIATATAEWLPRDSAANFVFNNKIWIMGGLNGNGVTTNENNAVHYWEAEHLNDIWSSLDGISWIQESAHASWSARRSMSVIEFKDKLWMFGGWSPIDGYMNDIWSSPDGIIWTKEKEHAAWSVREGQTALVFNDMLWLMGGVDYDSRSVKNDIWYSSDGLNWFEATTSALWSPRWDHATVVFNDTIFLTGGMNLSKETFDDVWYSPDGVNWNMLTHTPLWQSRQGHGLAVLHDLIWSIGRLDDEEAGGVNDVWYSRNGFDWEKTESDPLWRGREDHGVSIFNDRIFVLGGMDADWKWRNDVWQLKI